MSQTQGRESPMAWAEDRALLGSTPSADPGAKTGAGIGTNDRSRALCQSEKLRDWHECEKPSRQEPRNP